MMVAAINPTVAIVIKYSKGVQSGPFIPMKDQNVGLDIFMMRKLPNLRPKGCIPACRYPARTGSSSYLTAAASIPTSPMLISRTITKRMAIVSRYFSWSCTIKANGKVSREVPNKLNDIQNLRLP